MKDIIYKWARKDTAVERDKEISLPQFDIVKTVQKYRLEELSSGKPRALQTQSCLHFCCSTMPAAAGHKQAAGRLAWRAIDQSAERRADWCDGNSMSENIR